MNSPEAKEALDVLARPAAVRAARGDLEHLGRGRGLVRRRPRRAGLGLRRERRLDRDRSPTARTVVGNVGVALPPTAEGVMAAAEAGEGYIGYYDGGAFGIPHSSKNKEAALLWLQYIGQPSVQADWAVAGRAHRPGRDLRRPEGPGAGRQGRRLLHADAREGAAVRRRAAVSRSTVRCARRSLRSSTRRSSASITPEDALDQAAAAAEAELQQLGYRKRLTLAGPARVAARAGSRPRHLRGELAGRTRRPALEAAACARPPPAGCCCFRRS